MTYAVTQIVHVCTTQEVRQIRGAKVSTAAALISD